MNETQAESCSATQNRIKAIAAEIFEIDVNSIDFEMGPDDVDRWDSMNHLRLITEIESSFSIRLTMQQIQQIQTLQDLARVISENR